MLKIWRTLHRLGIVEHKIRDIVSQIDFIVYCNKYSLTEPEFEFPWQKWYYSIKERLGAGDKEV